MFALTDKGEVYTWGLPGDRLPSSQPAAGQVSQALSSYTRRLGCIVALTRMPVRPAPAAAFLCLGPTALARARCPPAPPTRACAGVRPPALPGAGQGHHGRPLPPHHHTAEKLHGQLTEATVSRARTTVAGVRGPFLPADSLTWLHLVAAGSRSKRGTWTDWPARLGVMSSGQASSSHQ